MNQPDDVAQLAEAISGLEQVIAGIAAILEGHGAMLARLLAAAEEPLPEETRVSQLLAVLIGRLDRQQGTLDRIETAIATCGAALAKTVGQQ